MILSVYLILILVLMSKGAGEMEEELMNNLVDHAIKDQSYTCEYVMKPEIQDKIKAKIPEILMVPLTSNFFNVSRHLIPDFISKN